MTRLRRVDSRSRGWTRRRAGSGFRYLDAQGRALGQEDVAQIRALAIPPAWQQVWICPLPNGHLQYLYHPDWRTGRDREKFDRVLAAGAHLGRARRTMIADLGADGMPARRATAVAARLLDLGAFRIGNDAYLDANGSFGLTTLERRHVRRRGKDLHFRFTGKSGIAHDIVIDDPALLLTLAEMRGRRGGSDRLLAYRGPEGWSDVSATMVNEYLADLVGTDFTAKDFRTWHGTVLAAVSVAQTQEPGDTEASRRRAVKEAVSEVAAYLGNTPTIARGSYIDPRVIEQYESGRTIDVRPSRRRPPGPRRQAALEAAVVRLLRNSS